MKLLLLASLMITSSGPACAAVFELVCENPRREYTVDYSPGDKAISINGGETLYPVLVDDARDESRIITATTPNDGPTARLFLYPYLKIEFWSDGQLFQTDGCYSRT